MFDLIGEDDVPSKLKALELLVKIRLGGERVKPKDEDAPGGSRKLLDSVLEGMNAKGKA